MKNTVSIPYRGNERNSNVSRRKCNNVSIPYRGNESWSPKSIWIKLMRYQFLIEVMKDKTRGVTNENVSQSINSL